MGVEAGERDTSPDEYSAGKRENEAYGRRGGGGDDGRMAKKFASSSGGRPEETKMFASPSGVFGGWISVTSVNRRKKLHFFSHILFYCRGSWECPEGTRRSEEALLPA